MLADFLCFWGILIALSSRAENKKQFRNASRRIRSRLLLLVAYMLAIIGTLNTTGSDAFKTRIPVIANYVLAVVFSALSYAILAIADKSKQDGRCRPLNYFGRPRQRRLLFVLFGFFIITPLLWASATIVIHGIRPPTAIEHVMFCVFLVTVSAVLSASLVLERFRKTGINTTWGRSVLIATLCLLTFTGIMRMTFAYSLYFYVMSSITVLCAAVAVLFLWQVQEIDDPGLPFWSNKSN